MTRGSAVADIRGLGIVLTMFMEKKNPITGAYAKRFLVLTHESFHWFKRDEGYDLFGEERGHVGIGTITGIKITDADKRIFEITSSTDKKRRLFRCLPDQDTARALEWVSAINSVIECFRSHPKRRTTISNFHALDDLDLTASKNRHSDLIVPRVVSLKSSLDGTEMIIARNPAWDRVIVVPFVQPGDALMISTSNGGVATVPAEMLADRYEEGTAAPFDVAILGISLQTYITMSVMGGMPESDAANANASNMYAMDAAVWARVGLGLRSWPAFCAFHYRVIGSLVQNDSHTIITWMVICYGVLSYPSVTAYYHFLCVSLAAYTLCLAFQKAIDEVTTGCSKVCP